MLNWLPRSALVIVAAASMVVAVRAQYGSAQQAAAPQGSQEQEVVLVGCLVRIDTSARRPGTTGSTPPGKPVRPANSGFGLKDVAVASKEGATGPVATRSEQEVALAKSDKVDLAAHLNRQVEIKGRTGPGASPADGRQSGNVSSSGGDSDFHVTSIRTISDTCPPRI